MMGMIGNKTLLVPLMYSKTSKLFLFMICTIAGWRVDVKLIRSERWEQNARTKPQIFLFYVALGMSERTIPPPKAKQ